MKWNGEAMKGYKFTKKGESKGKPLWAEGWSFKDTGWSMKSSTTSPTSKKPYWAEGYSGALEGYKLKKKEVKK
jgi:hypothetical protein